jgi:hypothetical protein
MTIRHGPIPECAGIRGQVTGCWFQTEVYINYTPSTLCPAQQLHPGLNIIILKEPGERLSGRASGVSRVTVYVRSCRTRLMFYQSQLGL